MKTDDYVIIQVENKNHLLKITSKHAKGDDIQGMLEKDRHLKPKTTTFSDSQVIAVLGPKPASGTAYGQKIEPWKRTKVHDFWGNIHFFRDMEKDETKALKLSLDHVANVLTKQKTGFFVPLELEIRPAKGRWTGMYRYNGGGEELDQLQLMPKSFVDPGKIEVVKQKYYTDYLLLHESAHGIWFKGMNAKLKARWIEAYHATLLLAEAEAKDVHKLGKEFVKARVDIKSFKDELEEPQQKLFDSCVSWIKDYHNLSRDHLNILCDADEYSAIGKLWPNEKIMDNDFEIPLGDYAATKPEEFFAEAYSFHFAGKIQIPKNILALLQKTIDKVKQ